VIQIESVQIQEFRGIRDLTLTMNRGSFVISGPNGSGKSGVVDAIQFALTGEVGRLKGAGTGDLSLADHGPHVEKRSDPEASWVRLNVYLPQLKKSASITRTIKKPNQPQITPNDAAVKAEFTKAAEHPETTLARREIIKFILTEATQRSRDFCRACGKRNSGRQRTVQGNSTGGS
jgi:DNA repair exonuclease SbcCD ATPase subunit